MNHGKAQPGSFSIGFGCEIRIEIFIHDSRIDPMTGIGYTNPGIFSGVKG
ncbi:MAG: hypothetical protein WA151_16960 [Desulfatirhabdiaceae bacterium]